MFGVISQLFGHLWPWDNLHGSEQNESKPDNELLGQETEKLTKSITGKVTKLYDDSGIIDEEIFFSFDKVIGGLRPKLDAEVHVEASRKSVHVGWQADRVEVLLTDWSSFGKDGTPEVVIGEITDITEANFTVNCDIICSFTCLTFGYVPSKGDWIRAEVLKDRGVICDIKTVGPLREQTITGCITAISQGHGYINKDIFYSFGVCPRGYTPRKGHNVIVTAIESNQGKCKWRALSIVPRVPKRDVRVGPAPQMKFREELLGNKQGVLITDNVNFGDITLESTMKKVIGIRYSNSKLKLRYQREWEPGMFLLHKSVYREYLQMFIIVDEARTVPGSHSLWNDGEGTAVLKSVEGLDDNGAFSIELTTKKSPEFVKDDKKYVLTQDERQNIDRKIYPNTVLNLTVKVNPRFLGEVNQLVVFHFDSFQIGRYLSVNVRDEQQQYLNARTPFQKRQFFDKRNALNDVINTRYNQQWVIPGERPMFQKRNINISTKLRQYEIPRNLRHFILEKLDLCSLVPSLGESLSMGNYQERFSALLHIEEVQMELEMREFDLKQVSLKAVGDFLSLTVPGLAEGRPSLLIGDRVILVVCGSSPSTPKYEGFIHEVLSDEIYLKFHEDFHITFDMDYYDVMFFFNRTPLRRAHRAVELAYYIGEKVLFPRCANPSLPQTLRQSKTKQDLYNSKLNERQRAAVARILSGQCRPMPYVLFGPPGTGKTVTLVEAILQVFHRISSSRILACTPSNSAADLIAERLHQSGGIVEGDMVRLNAFQRQQNIPENIENYSTNIEELDMAAHYRIIVCTCTTAGQLHSLGLPPGHFTHVFIDEAGQATEPESLVPISLLAGTEGQTILGGDPYQLGAVLRSTTAKCYGLDISLLERLMALPPYLRDTTKFSNHGSYDPLTVTKLVHNYRSHEVLLYLPSQIFYHSELIACADEELKNSFCDWDSLPARGFPIVFHGIKGDDLREGNSPSWFNAVEAVQVIRYVQELRSFKKRPVDLSDIGIITPYRKQVEKIRLLLERLGINQVKVGSVEEFQGQERRVIIISTVRSSSSLLGFDFIHNLGFLSNPKRFNVAITRAQSLMIMIGNPHVLSKDTNWRALLQYCVDNNAYVGCDLPDLTEDLETNSKEDDDLEGNSSLVQGSEENIQSGTGHAQNNDLPVCGNLCNVAGPTGLQGINKDREIGEGLLGAVSDVTGVCEDKYRKTAFRMSTGTKNTKYTMDHEGELRKKVDLSQDRVGEQRESVGNLKLKGNDLRDSNETMVAVATVLVNNVGKIIKPCPGQINEPETTFISSHTTEQASKNFIFIDNVESVSRTNTKQNDEDSDDDLEEFVYTPDPS